jgi:hypothetical protein
LEGKLKKKRIVFVALLALVSVVFIYPADQSNTPIGIQKKWTVADSKAYARDRLLEWNDKQWYCLTNLWGKESAWNPEAYNKIKVQGKNAGGIPQLLGLDPNTPAPKQIDRGLAYIYHRYKTPCQAWKFFKENNWH